MAIVHFENLAAFGLIPDTAPYALPPEAWSEGKNARFYDGKVQSFLGSAELYPTWNGVLSSQPLWLLPWNDVGGSYWLLGTASQIGLADASTILDVTATAGTYGGSATSLWSGGILGGVPVLNIDSGTDYPQSWNSGTSKFVDLPNWPANTYASRLGLFKQYLVALDVTAAGSRNPHMIKWSSQAFPGSVPQYWDNVDSNDSNESHLPEGGGFLIDQQLLGQWNILYKENLTYIMSYVGPPYVFAFSKTRFNSGILAPRCAQAIDRGRHCVVTKNDIIVHDAQQSESVVNQRWRTWFFNNLDPDSHRKTFMVVNQFYDEVWICFVSRSVAGTYADTALVWNYTNNTFTIRELESYAHVAAGVVDKGGSPVIDNITTIIDSDTNLINGAPFGANQERLLGASSAVANEKLVEFDITNQERGVDRPCYVRRTDLAIAGQDRAGNLVVDPSRTKLWKRIWPKLESTGVVQFYIGFQKVVEGPVTWKGPWNFDPATDRYFDANIQGKVMAIQAFTKQDVAWKLSGFLIDVELISDSV